MAPQKLTDYERRRLENIKRNDEVLAALKIRSKLDELSTSTKRSKSHTKSYKVSLEKKLKTETPVVIRRSLRTQGLAPDPSTAAGLKDAIDETLRKKSRSAPKRLRCSPQKQLPLEPGPITMNDAYIGIGASKTLIDIVMALENNSKESDGNGSIKGSNDGSFDMSVGISDSNSCGYLKEKYRVKSAIDLESMQLEEKNIARILPGKIMNLRFFPTSDMRMVVAGNKFGNVGFWNVEAQEEDGDGIYVYHPHSGPVSGIVIHPFSMSKMFTSCYDGFIRLLDVEKEVFDLVYSGDHSIFSISQQPHDVKSLYFSEGHGDLNVWDERSGKSSMWIFHEARINTIDFNPENINIMATSSSDGTACLWDLRYIDADKPKSLGTVSHKRAVHSAYFSPSGKHLVTTSFDDRVGLLSGVNYEDLCMIYHYNQTGRWISSFRATWGWDDSYIFIGNMKRGVDVISTACRKTVVTLQSEHMSAIPCRFDAHPYNVGMLAGATSGGQVYIWTQC